MTTTFQLARRLNEMRRIILAHSKPNWRSLALTHAETVSLMAKGAIKTMPDAEFEDLGEEYMKRKKAADIRAKRVLFHPDGRKKGLPS